MQLAHIEIGDTATDLTLRLGNGCYLCQVSSSPDDVGVLYASAATAPSDDADYFGARGHEFFTFNVGPGEPKTWCKSGLAASSFTLALALVE